MIDKWARFLYNEKIDPKKLCEDDLLEIIYLCEELAKIKGPFVNPHKKKLESRALVVNIAIDLGIDLTGFKYRGKMLLGRGLLDIWLIEYKKRFGSSIGTLAEWEVKRRNIKTKLKKRVKNDLKKSIF